MTLYGPSASTGPVAYEQVTFVNDASYPAISRDGTLVAYVRGEPWGELFAIVAARAPQKVVIHDLASNQVVDVGECRPCQHLQWSSDGASLFVLTERGVTRFSRLGGVLREFVTDRVFFLAVAPDGGAFATAKQLPGEILVTDTQTSATTSISVAGNYTSILGIDWAPSGHRLAVLVANSDRRHVWSVAPDGPQTVIAEDVGPVNIIKWSPAGDQLYYLKTSGLSRDLWEVRVSGQTGKSAGTAAVVLGGLQAGPNFSISADGRSLAYTRETRFANLWTASLDSRGAANDEPKQLTTGTRLDQYPAVSPDGRRLAFVRSDGRSSDVHVMPRDGGAATRVTFLERVFGAPAWSPDGSRLAFCAEQAGARRVWTIPATGGAATAIDSTACTALESEVPVSWAPDADILYQRDGNRNYHRIDMNAPPSPESALVADPQRGWVFGPRTHGRQVAVLWNEMGPAGRRRGLWILGPESGAERDVAPSVWPMVWTPDGSSIIGYDDQASAIVSVAVPSGQVRVIRSLQGRRVALVPAAAPDGRSMAYSAHSILADVWVVRNFGSK
jgi:dipeptidyl aminopeptidase/acylaminoacyl peptidase